MEQRMELDTALLGQGGVDSDLDSDPGELQL